MRWKKRKSAGARGDQRAVHTLNLDDLKEDEKHELYKAMSEHAQMTRHAGHVEHAYTIDTVATLASCPRCQASTQQQYANFIYATQKAPRVMFAPAGYFCTACPTVVIDEGMIRQGISAQFTYQGVLGLDHEGEQRPEPQLMWFNNNGRHETSICRRHCSNILTRYESAGNARPWCHRPSSAGPYTAR